MIVRQSKSRYASTLRPLVANVTGTFTGEMTLPDGTVIAPTGKVFDLQFGQTTKWDGDRLIIISAFWDSALQAKQLGLA